jgi:hypothetical protein
MAADHTGLVIREHLDPVAVLRETHGRYLDTNGTRIALIAINRDCFHNPLHPSLLSQRGCDAFSCYAVSIYPSRVALVKIGIRKRYATDKGCIPSILFIPGVVSACRAYPL